MLGIFRKDFWLAFLTPIIVLPMLALYWFGVRRVFDENVPFMTANLILILLMNAITTVEINENRQRGYEFLRGLPLTAREIVAGKFAIVFVLDIVMLVFALILPVLFDADPQHVALGRAYMTAVCMVGLILGGLHYLLWLRFGNSSLGRGILIIIPIAFMAALILMMEIFAANFRHIDISRFYELASIEKVLAVCVICLAGFWGLMHIAGTRLSGRYIENGD